MDPVLLTRSGPDIPWGFRLSGGADQQRPLTVQRVTPGSIAAQGLVIGDLILRVGNRDASGLTYADAMEIIKTSGDRLELYTSRSNAAAQPQPQEFSSISSPSNFTNDVHQSPDSNSSHHHHRSPQREVESDHGRREGRSGQHKAPDPVLNMAARTTEYKRPFTYAPDIQSLQQQRRRVQRRNYEPTKSAAPSQRYAEPPHSPQVQRSRPLPQTTSQTQDAKLENGGSVNNQPIYGGPEIPSKTFQMLQSYTTSNSNEPGITDLARAAQRRQKRREKLHHGSSASGGSDEVAVQPEFDEAAYLAGQISVLGQKSPVSTSSYRNSRIGQNQEKEEEEEEERSDDKPFDERAYLAGRIPLVKGGPIDPSLFDLPSGSGGKEEGKEETEGRDDENKKPFDERAYLAGRIPLVKGGTIDPTQFNVPERRAIRRHREPYRPRLKQPFNEGEYLAGKLNILGQEPDRQRNVPSRLPSGGGGRGGGGEAKPSWCKKDEDMVSEDEFDEEAFLSGKFPIVRRSVDRELPLRRAVLERAKFARERASWQRENQEQEENGRGGTCSETEFDERAFLAGRSGRRIATEKEYATDTEADVPQKTLRILRRSVSSERSADEYTGGGWNSSNEGGLSGDETGSDQEKPYNVYMYQGRDIPSKIFSRLKKTMDRKEAAERSKIRPLDPIERLKKKSLENLGIDVDVAMERLEIGKHDPDAYMEMLKKSVEENEGNIRIEADNEVTDF